MRCAKRIVIKMSNKQKKINRKNHAQSASIKPITPQNQIDPRENAVDAKGGMWYTCGTKYDKRPCVMGPTHYKNMPVVYF